MDTLAIEREGTAIGNALFQQIIADLKVRQGRFGIITGSVGYSIL